MTIVKGKDVYYVQINECAILASNSKAALKRHFNFGTWENVDLLTNCKMVDLL